MERRREERRIKERRSGRDRRIRQELIWSWNERRKGPNFRYVKNNSKKYLVVYTGKNVIKFKQTKRKPNAKNKTKS